MFPHPLPFSPWEKGAWYRLNNTPSDVSGGFLFGFAGASAPPDESGGYLFGVVRRRCLFALSPFRPFAFSG